MAGIYPRWVYSDIDPPQLVLSPAHEATMPAGFSATPSANAMVLPVAIPPTAPTVVVVVKAPTPPNTSAVVVKVPKRPQDR